jgi:hypothetical protein
MIESKDPDAVRLDELAWTDVGGCLEDIEVRAACSHFTSLSLRLRRRRRFWLAAPQAVG